MKSTHSNLVYSTDGGRMCPGCRLPVASCACKAAAEPQGDGIARVARHKRNGKTVTVVKGLALDAAALAALGKQLRTACGSGGTVKEGTIEVQGDHCETVVAALEKDGYRTRRA
jgi:translation initiation factor 1